MKLVDFIVFYTMVYYEKNKLTGLFWESKLKRSIFLAGLSATFWLFIVAEILLFLFMRINLVDVPFSKFMLIVSGVLFIQLFRYIYIKKNRYEFITSNQYKPFTIGITVGMILSFLIFVFSLLLSIGIALLIHFYLLHHR